MQLPSEGIPGTRFLRRSHINSPSNGSSFPAGKTITIVAGANSFSGVDRVTFLVNGEPIATDYRFPYKARYTLPGPGKYVLHTVAYGIYGASKSSEGVVITAN